jgi:hypothetical protein
MLLRLKMAYLHFPRKTGIMLCSASPTLKVDEARANPREPHRPAWAVASAMIASE